MKKFWTLLLILIIFIEYFLLRNYFSYSFVFADDVFLYCKSIKEIFISPVECQFISSTLGRLFSSVFPIYLNVHPSYFKSQYFSYIEPIFFMLFIFLLNNLIFINKKINYLYPLGFLFASTLLFLIIQQQPYLTLFVYEGLFRMFMPSFIYIALLFMLIKKQNNNSTKSFISVCILAFLCIISNEVISITTIIGLFLYFLFSLKLPKSKQEIFRVALFLLSVFLGFIILVKTGVYFRKIDKLIYSFDNQYILNIIKDIPCYTKAYIHSVFLRHFIWFSILGSEIFFLLNKYKNNSDIKQTVKLILSFLSGLLIFFYMLVILGKSYYIEGNYWLIHSDLHIILDTLLCAFIFALLNKIVEYKLINDFRIGVMFYALSLILFMNNYNFYSRILNEEILIWRLNAYKTEKIIKIANINNKPAYIDEKLLEIPYFWYLLSLTEDNKIGSLCKNSPFIAYLNGFEKEENKIKNGFIFSNETTVNKEFAENGGIFTAEELKNPNFNNLLNKDFLLNKK